VPDLGVARSGRPVRHAATPRTITCWTIYSPKRRVIVNGFRTKKDLKAHYSAGVPLGCVVVKMKGHYLGPRKKQRPSTGEIKKT
jgi:hypothetical protein